MSTWQAATLITEDFPHWANPATLDVDPRGGTVELSLRDSEGNWKSFESFDTIGSYKVEVVNTPAIRISANSGAVFRWTWRS